LLAFEELQQAFEVIRRAPGVDYLRHATGAGRAARLPRARSST
jgi:hypothetical protein